MVRDPVRRTTKYIKKISGSIAKLRTDNYRKQQAANFAASAGRQVAVEIYVKDLISHHGISSLNHNYYILFAKGILKLLKKFEGATFMEELRILEDKWETRGLSGEILDMIKIHYAPSYSIGQPFRCDISLFDGEDTLS